MQFCKYNPLKVLLILSLVAASGCTTPNTNSIPPDFNFILDVHSPEKQTAQNIYIQINAKGKGHFERYNTGGTIHLDTDDMIVYESDQVVGTGNFKLRDEQVEQLWHVINENDFFQLTGDYRMAIGYSYAFISIEANNRSHQVFNIGMEVPEIRAIVEMINSMLPAGVVIIYREGFVP